ncbi:ATP-binding protein [Sphaerotilaceae bacterium SBD11-9]
MISAGRRLRDSYFMPRLLLCAVAVALPLLALHAYTLYVDAQDEKAEAVAAVAARSHDAAKEIDALLSRAERMLAFLATRQELKDLDGTRCAELMKGLTSVDPLLANVGAVDINGSPLCLSIVSPSRFKTYKDVAWFKEALGRPDAFLSKPFRGDISKRPLVNLVMPFKNAQGERIGFLGAAIDLTALTNTLLARNNLPEDSVVSLIGPDGTIFARNPGLGQWMGKPVPRDTREKQPRATQPLFVGAGPDGTERLYAQSWLTHYGLRAGAGVPMTTVIAKSEMGLRRSLFTTASVALLALLVAVWAARRLAAPLHSLGETARALGAGEPGTRADERLPGEFRPLAVEFNRMIDARNAVESSRRAQAAAEAANQAKGQFLAHMSHEIRTPMNAILGLTDLTLRSQLSDEQRRYLGQVQTAATSLLGIINDILDFSKIEAGKLELESRDFALAPVLERVRSVVSLKAQDKGLALVWQVDGEVPLVLVGDALRLEQALINLCSNAVKFTDHGEVVLRVEKKPALPDGRNVLRFSVRDTGPGLSPAQIAALFTPFTQGDASTTRQYGGTGLGLAITRQLVEMMGGSIGVHSMPERGSEFYFELPLPTGRREAVEPHVPVHGHASDDTLGQGSSWAVNGVPAALKGARILLAEDNELNRIVATDLLTHVAGAHISIAHNGEEAVAAVKGAPFDLVLMDVQMPVMDGYQATLAIRQVPGLRDLPIIAMTAHAMQRDRDQCLAVGMNGYVTKPFEPADLFTVLGKWAAVGRRLRTDGEVS